MLKKIQREIIAIWKFLRPQNKKQAFGFVLTIFAVSFVIAGFVSAETDTSIGGQVFSAFVKVFIQIIMAVSSLFIKLAIFFLSFILQIAGYNKYLDSTAVNIGWVMVRDITNMAFVVILLVIAFGTIIGLEQYEWKKMLGKFVIAAILVNFSRTICGVIIDVAQVVMITFVNGIAATAGGNLINMFQINDLWSFSKSEDLANQIGSDAGNLELYAAAVGSLVFSGITMMMMLVFAYMLAARMIVLWVLIVLSPLAFVLSVVPQTQKYASQWWQEFGNHVVVGPAVVFFLWLAFVTVGSGQINEEIKDGSQTKDTQKINQESAGLSKIMDWNKISSFAIAVGILLVGAKTAQSFGTVGGSAMSKATDFGKKVAMIGSGVAAGIWGAKMVGEGAKKVGKFGYERMPIIGGKAMEGYKYRIGRFWNKNVDRRRDKWAQSWEESSKAYADAKKTKRQLEMKVAAGQTLSENEKKDLERANKTLTEKKGVFNAAGRFIQRQIAGAVESGDRSDTKTKGWKEAFETSKKVTEIMQSTSSMPSGEAKQEELTDLWEAELLKKGKTAQKADAMIAHRLNAFQASQLGVTDEQLKAMGVETTAGDIAQISSAVSTAISAQEKGKVATARKDQTMSEVVKTFHEKNKGLLETINLAEQGKRLADNFIAKTKDEKLGELLGSGFGKKVIESDLAREMAKFGVESQTNWQKRVALETSGKNGVGSQYVAARANKEAFDNAYLSSVTGLMNTERGRRARNAAQELSGVREGAQTQVAADAYIERDTAISARDAEIKEIADMEAETKKDELLLSEAQRLFREQRALEEAINRDEVKNADLGQKIKDVQSDTTLPIHDRDARINMLADEKRKLEQKISTDKARQLDLQERRRKIPQSSQEEDEQRATRLESAKRRLADAEDKIRTANSVIEQNQREIESAVDQFIRSSNAAPELADARATVENDQSAIVSESAKGSLRDDLKNLIIGSRQHIVLQNSSQDAAVDALHTKFLKGQTDKNAMLKAWGDRARAISKRRIEEPSYKGSDESKIDEIWTQAVMKWLQENRFMDDPSGTSATMVDKRIEEILAEVGGETADELRQVVDAAKRTAKRTSGSGAKLETRESLNLKMRDTTQVEKLKKVFQDIAQISNTDVANLPDSTTNNSTATEIQAVITRYLRESTDPMIQRFSAEQLMSILKLQNSSDRDPEVQSRIFSKS